MALLLPVDPSKTKVRFKIWVLGNFQSFLFNLLFEFGYGKQEVSQLGSRLDAHLEVRVLRILLLANYLH